MSSTPAPSEPSKRLLGIYVLSILLFIGAALELADGLLMAANLGTSYERPTDRSFFRAHLAGAGVVFLAALALLAAKRLTWRGVLLLQLIGAAAQILPIRATLAALAEAERRGGDTGTLTALGYRASIVLELGIVGWCVATAIYLCRQPIL